jgi:class 3 adenylate cyclase
MRQERKVITVLFCDLGFTSRAEEMDPADVAALPAPYQARLKDELEHYGGTVREVHRRCGHGDLRRADRA